MKNTTLSLSMAGIAALVSLAFGQVSSAADHKDNCGSEAKKVKAAVIAAPEDVLKIVAQEVQAAPSCVCEIVKAAIVASKADKALVVDIVTTAAALVPDETPTIIACAIAQSPESARAIADKFGSGKGTVRTGKETVTSGKDQTGVERTDKDVDITDDFALFHAGVGGIYLTTPSSGLSNGGFIPRVNDGG